MDERLASLGIRTVAQLRDHPGLELESRFGRFGRRLSELAHGIDEHRVLPDRPTQSVSAEDIFAEDMPLAMLATPICRLAEQTRAAAAKTERVPSTGVSKHKTRD